MINCELNRSAAWGQTCINGNIDEKHFDIHVTTEVQLIFFVSLTCRLKYKYSGIQTFLYWPKMCYCQLLTVCCIPLRTGEKSTGFRDLGQLNLIRCMTCYVSAFPARTSPQALSPTPTCLHIPPTLPSTLASQGDLRSTALWLSMHTGDKPIHFLLGTPLPNTTGNADTLLFVVPGIANLN